MDLQGWMAAREIDDDEVARRANVDRSTISRIRRKKRNASPELAAELIALSDHDPGPNGETITWPEIFGLPASSPSPVEEAA